MDVGAFRIRQNGPSVSSSRNRDRGGEPTMASEHTLTLTTEISRKRCFSRTNRSLVDFWAEWCGPCRMIAPAVEGLADEYNGRVAVGKLNIDENPNTPQTYGVRSIPTLLLFKDGEVVESTVGVAGKEPACGASRQARREKDRVGTLPEVDAILAADAARPLGVARRFHTPGMHVLALGTAGAQHPRVAHLFPSGSKSWRPVGPLSSRGWAFWFVRPGPRTRVLGRSESHPEETLRPIQRRNAVWDMW